MYYSSSLSLIHLDFNSSENIFHYLVKKRILDLITTRPFFPLAIPGLYMEGLIVSRTASLTSESVTNTGLPRARELIRKKTGLTLVWRVVSYFFKESRKAHSIIDSFFQNVGITASCMNSENTCEKWNIPTIKQSLQTTNNSEPNNDYVNNVKMCIQGLCSSSNVLYDQHSVSAKVPASVGWACLEVAL